MIKLSFEELDQLLVHKDAAAVEPDAPMAPSKEPPLRGAIDKAVGATMAAGGMAAAGIAGLSKLKTTAPLNKV